MATTTVMGKNTYVDSEPGRQAPGSATNIDEGAIGALKPGGKAIDTVGVDTAVRQHSRKNIGSHSLIVNKIHEKFCQDIEKSV